MTEFSSACIEQIERLELERDAWESRWLGAMTMASEFEHEAQVLRAALEAAPKPRRTRVAGLWRDPDWRYVYWYNGQRQTALDVVNVGQMSGELGLLRDEDVTMAIYAADQELCDDDT